MGAKKTKEIEQAKKQAIAQAAAAAAARKVEAAEEKKEGEPAQEEKKAEEPAPEEEKKEKEEPAAQVVEEEKEEEEEEELDFEGLDVFGVQDVSDVGQGTPLYKDFTQDDWVMASLRYELALLVHAFRKDVNDPERTGIHLEHLPFYYNRYYKKNFIPKNFGKEKAEDVIALVVDTVFLRDNVLETLVAEEYEQLGIFVKLTEEARRNRMILVDSGDDSAKLQLQNVLGKGG